ncbi:uncharacterized protein LY79DRAFT_661580 [Colletotrichum navitas]|uniref:Transmembrane protein n=1 Tax=Colletotrichum navitas TaxID=681940 RepID=A0AAD8PSK8_9PEZI|nr:uncharacterized protein LY79DRAFT_661580 [Colletotrichum navitas]KAK1579895.1 hypothetical protein LY79DRAFT_661580 [Colletotrichum navitas]
MTRRDETRREEWTRPCLKRQTTKTSLPTTTYIDCRCSRVRLRLLSFSLSLSLCLFWLAPSPDFYPRLLWKEG